MSTPYLVEEFYSRIWNQGNVSAASEILTDDFEFRGSLGSELRGVDAFKRYVESVRISLAGYRCEILDCVAEGGHAFAKMRFSGCHVGTFRGFVPTNKQVFWMGAALFDFANGQIKRLWVLAISPAWMRCSNKMRAQHKRDCHRLTCVVL
jgi:steroid delta-isomerase-like uncharacterized protein